MKLIILWLISNYIAFCVGAKISKHLDKEIEKQELINSLLDKEIKRLKAKEDKNER